MIGLASEDAPTDLAVGGGKKILGVWRWSPRYCSAVMEGFIIGAAPVSCTMPRLKQDKRDNVNLSGILIASPIDDVKYITTKC